MHGTGNWKGNFFIIIIKGSSNGQLDCQQWSNDLKTFLPNSKHLLTEILNLADEMTTVLLQKVISHLLDMLSI